MSISYVQAIALGFSDCQVDAVGDAADYANLVRRSGITLPTKVELDAYIATNSATILAAQAAATGVTTLANGMPAYIEPAGGVLTSISTISREFFVKSSGTKNAYLSTISGITSNVLGFRLTRNALIRSVTIESSVAISSSTDAMYELRVNKSTSPLVAYQLDRNTSYKAFIDLSIPLTAGDELAVYINSLNNIVNPVCLIEFSWRN